MRDILYKLAVRSVVELAKLVWVMLDESERVEVRLLQTQLKNDKVA